MESAQEGSPRVAKYDVFISYSRDPDYRLARNLTSFLESFHKLPTPVSGAENGDEKTRLTPLKVCLDEVTFSLPPSAEPLPQEQRSVNPVVESYLAQSEELLVLCSANAAGSPWVCHELQWWLKHRGSSSIRLAVTEGEYPWDQPDTYFAPSILERSLHESICYDLRGYYGRQARDWRKVSDFNSERVRLAADLNGKSSGDILPLWHREQQRRQRRRFITILASAVVLFAISLVALYQTQQTLKERDLREAAVAHGIEQESSKLVAESYEILTRKPARALIKAFRAGRLHPGENATSALETAYRVVTFDALNRRENAQLTGSGPGYLAGRWKEGDLFTVFSADGRYAIFVSGRESDGGGKDSGRVFLTDTETHRTMELEAPDTWSKNARVEYVGFDSLNQHVFVTRYFRLSIYELDGSLVGGYDFSRFTKSPIHRVDGYVGGRFLLGADSKGGLWLVDPHGEQQHTLQGEWHGDALLWSNLNPEGSRAGLVFESGRAALLEFPNPDTAPTVAELRSDGVYYAGFPAGEQLLVAGRDGLVQNWEVSEPGQPRLLHSYTGAEGDIDWVSASEDGQVLLTVALDHTVTLLESRGGEVLDTFNFASDIDWAALRRLPRQVGAPAGARTLSVAGREWLASNAGAYLAEDGRLIPVTERFLKIRDILEAAGTTWILTGETGIFTSPGPTLRVDGYLSHRIPDELGKVNRILDLGDRALFATSKGVWQWRAGRFAQIQGIEQGIDTLRRIGAHVWASGNAVWRPGAAYRIDGLNAAPFPDANTRVNGVIDFQQTAWLMTGALGAPGPLYRVAGDRSERVPDAQTQIRNLHIIGDELWMLSAAPQPDGGWGPAYRWDGQRALAVPTDHASVYRIVDIEGEVWLAYRDQEGISHVGRYDAGNKFSVALAPMEIRQILRIGDSVWMASDRGAYRLEGKNAVSVVAGNPAVERIIAAEDPWIITSGKLHRVRDGRVQSYSVADRQVRDILAINSTTWVLTGPEYDPGPALRVVGDGLVPFRDDGVRVLKIAAEGERTVVTIRREDYTTEEVYYP